MHGGFHSPHHSISPHSLACTLSPPSLGQALQLIRGGAGSAPPQERPPPSTQTSGAVPGPAVGWWSRMGAGNIPFPWKTRHKTWPYEHPRAPHCLPPSCGPHLPLVHWENAAASFPFHGQGFLRTFIKISLLEGKMGSPFLLPSRAALTPLPLYKNTQERGFFSA